MKYQRQGSGGDNGVQGSMRYGELDEGPPQAGDGVVRPEMELR